MKVAAVEGGYPVSASSQWMGDNWKGCFDIIKARLNSGDMGCAAEAWAPAYSHGSGNFVDWIQVNLGTRKEIYEYAI